MGEKHPIEGMMFTAMQGLKDMIDVNTIVGDPVTTPDGSVIIPISKVSLGFGVGGSEFEKNKSIKSDPVNPTDNMFGGGSAGGISLSPVAFLVVGGGTIRLISAYPENSSVDRLLDMVPAAIDKISELFAKKEAKEEKAAREAAADDFDPEDYIHVTPPEDLDD